MAVTAALVKELRERTGAGMMECKKALVECDGDIEIAIEHLRKTGLAQADKKSGRVAAEGKIILAVDKNNKGVMVEVNCETDFVAKDENFLRFANDVASQALAMGSTDVAAIMALPSTKGGSLEEARQALVAKIGENIQLRRAASASVENGVLGAYVHGGRIGVLVAMEGGSVELAKDIAMHVAAVNPAYVAIEDVPADQVEKEKAILVAQAADSGKPAEIIEKMVQGRLRKYLGEITLLGQPFVKDPDQSVETLLKQAGARVTGFQRLEVGEGIEKKEDNFADEVMAQVRGS
jgi:elongation factor Ts